MKHTVIISGAAVAILCVSGLAASYFASFRRGTPNVTGTLARMATSTAAADTTAEGQGPNAPATSAAAGLESQELPSPSFSPVGITSGIPTYVTINLTLPDSSVRKPKLQFLDPTRGHWKTIRAFRDDGKDEDSVPADGVYAVRIRLVDSSGTTQLAIPPRKSDGSAVVKGTAPSPVDFRVAAKRQGQRTTLVSATFSIPTLAPRSVVVGDGVTVSQVIVAVPQTVDSVSILGNDTIELVKGGLDGYSTELRLFPNPSHLPLTEWIRLNAFGGSDQSDGFQSTSTAGLPAIEYHVDQEDGHHIYLWLDDTAHSRVIQFAAQPTGGEQSGTFSSSMPEIMSIIESLQQ